MPYYNSLKRNLPFHIDDLAAGVLLLQRSVVNPAALVVAVLRAVDITITCKLDWAGKTVSTLIALQHLDRYFSFRYIFVLLSGFLFPAVVKPST